MQASRALFDAFPRLGESLPHAAMAELPTPVEAMPDWSEHLGSGRLFVKRDDLSAKAYGGNKVRKLEFLLQAARERGAKEVVTFGYAGSNHCTATAIHAARLGLRSISMLTPQLSTTYLRRNLLASFAAGAELNHYASVRSVKIFTPFKMFQHRHQTGARPYLIPPGGSSPLGTVGFVNAAFELKRQIDAGLLPEPDYIYVAFSSMGTTAGLALGLLAAGINAQIEAIQVVSERAASKDAAVTLARNTWALIRAVEPAFPAVDDRYPNLNIRNEFFGGQYARMTDDSVSALRLFSRSLKLDPELAFDGTYSGKALAGLLSDARAGRIEDRTVLFWNTFNSRPFWKQMDLPHYKELPKQFWRYFEEKLQDQEKN